MNIVLTAALQVILLVVLAPLVTGVIKKIKAHLQCRVGAGIFQVYYDIGKHMKKETVIANSASWIYIVSPYIVFSALITAAMLLPVIAKAPLSFTGNIFVLIYLLALGRLMMTLAALESGSAFGGMASSREVSLSALIEPSLVLALISLAISGGSTNLSTIIGNLADQGAGLLNPAHFLSAAALLIVVFAEIGRIPVDNPDTHLELTMIHEGMLLEYSGKELALLIWAAAVKQLIMLTLFSNLFLPWGMATGWGWVQIPIAIILYLLKILVLSVLLALIESGYAKMRLFKVPGLLATSLVLAFLAIVSQLILRG